jgi:DNA repair protein RecO (recombination protein O)
MEWTGEGLIIGVRRHGETSVIAEAMVKGRGRHLGLVRGGRSSRQSATLQPGNTVQLTWRARIEEHLGTYAVELLQARAANVIAERMRLYACQLLCDHLRLLPERDPHDRLLIMALTYLDGEIDATALARFELFLLEELGFGLDLDTCAVTGVNDGLTHVSPKTGRAVCASAAEPYLDRLLRLPQFLVSAGEPGPDDLRDAFKLTGHFLDMHVWSARNIPPPATRDALIEILLRAAR